MRAIIIRHYKTRFNVSERILGWGDSPRDRDWRADVDFIGTQLLEHGVSIDAIHSSDLKRSRETAKYFGRCFGITSPHKTPALNEVNYGKLNKKTKKWVAKHYPQHKTDADFVYPQGESFRQMQQRSAGYLSALAMTQPQQTVLIVVHAGVIRGLVSHFLNLNYAEHLKHKISHSYIGDFQFDGNTCVGYDELGKASGFVHEGIIEIPFSSPRPATVQQHMYSARSVTSASATAFA